VDREDKRERGGGREIRRIDFVFRKTGGGLGGGIE